LQDYPTRDYIHNKGATRSGRDVRATLRPCSRRSPRHLRSPHHADRFTDRWADIRREALVVADMLDDVPRFHDIMPAQADISANDGRDWRVFIMKAYDCRGAAR
jgi:hypothetical protein